MGQIREVVLSDGDTVAVRQLGLFELDTVAPELKDPGPFVYTIELGGGQTASAPYDLNQILKEPEKPDVPRDECKPFSIEAMKWQEYDIWRAALAHQQKRLDIAQKRLLAIADYIMENCVEEKDRARIVDERDWDAVQSAALVPEVTPFDLEAALAHTFSATYQGQEIFEAMSQISGGGGSYQAIRAWENQLMIQLRMTEEEYGKMPVSERARKIVALKIDGWMGLLDMERQRKSNRPGKK